MYDIAVSPGLTCVNSVTPSIDDGSYRCYKLLSCHLYLELRNLLEGDGDKIGLHRDERATLSFGSLEDRILNLTVSRISIKLKYCDFILR